MGQGNVAVVIYLGSQFLLSFMILIGSYHFALPKLPGSLHCGGPPAGSGSAMSPSLEGWCQPAATVTSFDFCKAYVGLLCYACPGKVPHTAFGSLVLTMCDSPATAFPWWKGGTTGGSARAAGCVYSTGLLTQIHISGCWRLLPCRLGSSLTGPPDRFLETTKRAAGFDKSVVHVLGYCSIIWDDSAQIDELVHFMEDGHWCWSWLACRYLVEASDFFRLMVRPNELAAVTKWLMNDWKGCFCVHQQCADVCKQ